MTASATLSPLKAAFTSVWILTAQIKKMGPNITVWAPRISPGESGEEERYTLPFLRHDRILGESRLGPSPMTVIENPRILPADGGVTLPEYRFVRRLVEEDEPKLAALAERESALLAFVRDRAAVRNLPMLFMDAVGNFAANDFLLYYTAEGRVDFRELLKDIHGKFRGRVELRQISPREYTSILDGLGACGKTLCCSSFLKSFKTISTRMAREHESDTSSMKSTGMCGRLKCCLTFETGDGGAGQEGSSGGGCCSKKSASKDPDWIPMNSFMTPPVPDPSGPSEGGRPGSPRLSGHAPQRPEKWVSRTENRYRKDSNPRG